ncbi:MAG: gluconate 2-dehydrogenase subunit 3 family protein [Gemmatimonadetes bacterium]|nr:gluconate 2-dehydrogenase subunit 3 family protein [Gemmatimonadota bacterium]
MSDSKDHPSRRDALRTLAAGAAALPVAGALGRRALPTLADAPAPPDGAEVPATAPHTGPRGTPSDPDLLHPKRDWPRKLNATEMVALTALCDTIIPADAHSPSASAVGTPAFINEYVSHPNQERDLVRVRGGLAWLDAESHRRFARPFGRLAEGEKTQLCDDLCYLPKAKPEFRAAARFFDFVRDLSAAWFYSSDAGMKDLQYIGNVALPRFDGPPPEVLKHLGLA